MSEAKKRDKITFFGRRFGGLVVVLLALYSLLGFFLLPHLIDARLEKEFTLQLDRSTKIEKVKFNPFTLLLELEGLQIEARQGEIPLARFEQLRFDLAGFLSLANRALVMEEVTVAGAFLRIVRNQDASYNFADFPLFFQPLAPENGAKDVFHFSLNNIRLSGAAIEFSDDFHGVVHRAEQINLNLPRISNLPIHLETHVEPTFAAVVNGTPFVLSGTIKPFADSLATRFQIDIDNLDLPHYLAYLPGSRNFVLHQGRLSSRLELIFNQSENQSARLSLEGTVILQELSLGGLGENQDQRFFLLPEVVVGIAPGNLLAGEIFLGEVRFKEPELNLCLQANGELRLPSLQLVDKASGAAGGGEGSVAPMSGGESAAPAAVRTPETGRQNDRDNKSVPVFTLDRLWIEHGRVNLRDERVSPGFTAVFNDLDFSLQNFASGLERTAKYHLKLTSGAGETLVAAGELDSEPLALRLDFACGNLSPERYRAYYHDYFRGHFVDGRIDLGGGLFFSAAEKELSLNDLAVRMKDLQLRAEAGREVFALPEFELAGGRIDFRQKAVRIDSLKAVGGKLDLLRNGDGELDWSGLLPPVTSSAPTVADGSRATEPWQVYLEKAGLHKFTAVFKDLMPAAGATLKVKQLDLELEKVGFGAKPSSGFARLFLQLGAGGTLKAQGPLVLDPLGAELDLRLENLALSSLQPYLQGYFDLLLTRGVAGLKGHLSLRRLESGPEISFSGGAGLRDLQALAGSQAQEFVKLEKLTCDGLSLRSQPLAVQLERVSIQALKASLVKEPDGSNSLALVLRSKKAAANPMVVEDEIQEQNHEALFKLKELVLTDSALFYLDRTLEPHYELVLDELNGRVQGLNSLEEKEATVNFSGRLNHHSPLKITGELDPLGRELFADLKISCQDFGMTELTPYSGRYLGQTIGKGKLSLDLEIKLEDRNLFSNNRIFLDQFAFGEAVESSQSLNLPVTLAVALLRDRQGEIHLRVPVRGDLDDPKFSLGGVVFKIFVNLVTKAVTSPFSLLGALVGDSEELNRVEFAPGRFELDEMARSRLDKLAAVLFQRPALKVEIQGRAASVSDRQVLSEERFQHLLKAEKFKEKGGSGGGASELAEVVVTESEFEHYLWRAYKTAPFVKEKNLLGLVKKIEALLQEARLRDFVKVSDADLLLLAQHRARAVMSYLAERGPVENRRLFLLEPQLPAAEAETVAGREVEIKIK
ncbi:MAG TPA: DUF748 domain-containing protein [Proteobacteria bacterium]|nr:DUF748 domain-containing protein [Pseudomonadota bacterium]